MLYGILGWGYAAKTTLQPIQVLQNIVLRIIKIYTERLHSK